MSESNINFYTVIIGTELLNGRRVDSHFSFVNKELLKRGHEQKANFVVKDIPEFMTDIYTLIKNDPNSVLFSFGGIGSTPDDYTREIASKVFRESPLETNQEALEIIKDIFKEEAYPHRVKMAELPKNCELLANPVNRIPAFGLDKRFFFVPGFPKMAQSMILDILDRYYPQGKKKLRKTIKAFCTENILIDFMKMVPDSVELSSLPTIPVDGKKKTVLSLGSYDEKILDEWFEKAVDFMNSKEISFEFGE
ncbi:MAG: molybdopterin-binding protein [Campylobacterales bacterium]|nr:molybdopterin-binding protein [Campylobacterales bacterium]